jgi:hypothetical protein
MLLDSNNQFSAQQAVTAIGSTDSTNIVDLGVARDISDAPTDDLFLLCEVIAAFTSGGSATLQVQVATAPDNGSGAPGAWTVLYQSAAIPVASLTAGSKILPGALAGPTSRFVKLTYVVGTAVMTAGTITAAFVPSLDVQPTRPGSDWRSGC